MLVDAYVHHETSTPGDGVVVLDTPNPFLETGLWIRHPEHGGAWYIWVSAYSIESYLDLPTMPNVSPLARFYMCEKAEEIQILWLEEENTNPLAVLCFYHSWKMQEKYLSSRAMGP